MTAVVATTVRLWQSLHMPALPPPVTMKDVAQACGVSVVTVSRALRGDRRHSEATRSKIHRMATKMGYRPNPLVSALMSARGRQHPGKSTVNLGILNLGTPWEEHPFYIGALEQARALGYSIEAFHLARGAPAGIRLRRILQSRGVKGLLILPAPGPNWEIEFDFSGFAAATIGYSVVSPNLPRVVTDSYGRLSQVLERVSRLGYRKVGLLSSPNDNERLKNQYLAAVEVHHRLHRSGARVHRLDLESDHWRPATRRALTDWVKQHRLEAVISQLAGAEEQLERAGFSIPRTLAFVFLHRHGDPRITCMDQMQEWIGRKAADVVVGMINRNEFEIPAHSQTVMIPSVWREGLTLPAKRQG